MQLTKTFYTLSVLLGAASASFTGDATFFFPGLGACGLTNGNNDFIAALSTTQYGNGSNCGRNIRVNFQGRSVVVKVVDKCPGCATNDVDLSPIAFSQLASQDLGRIQVTWDFV